MAWISKTASCTLTSSKWMKVFAVLVRIIVSMCVCAACVCVFFPQAICCSLELCLGQVESCSHSSYCFYCCISVKQRTAVTLILPLQKQHFFPDVGLKKIFTLNYPTGQNRWSSVSLLPKMMLGWKECVCYCEKIQDTRAWSRRQMYWTSVLSPMANEIAIKCRAQIFKHGVNSLLGTLRVCFASFTFLGAAAGSRVGGAVPAREHAVAVWPLAPRRVFLPGEEELVLALPGGAHMKPEGRGQR